MPKGDYCVLSILPGRVVDFTLTVIFKDFFSVLLKPAFFCFFTFLSILAVVIVLRCCTSEL